jgi:hypothetical protein
MHPAVAIVAENVLQNQHLLHPLAFLISAIVANVNTPVQHSLLITSISWLFIWLATVFQAGSGLSGGVNNKRIAGWAAGAFLALAEICDRAARDREGTWWTKALLPLLVTLIPENGFWTTSGALPSPITSDESSSESTSEQRPSQRSFVLVTIVSLSAITALGTPYSSSPTSVLGICGAIFLATGLVLFEGAIRCRKDEGHIARRGFMSANGSFSRFTTVEKANPQQGSLAALRDVAGVMAFGCGVATYLMEAISSDAITWGPELQMLDGDWKAIQYPRMVRLCLFMIIIDVMKNFSLFIMLLRQGAVATSSLLVFSYIYARLHWSASFTGVWFTALFASAAMLVSLGSSSTASGQARMRFRRIISVVAVLSFGLFALWGVFSTSRVVGLSNSNKPFQVTAPERPLKPVPMDLKLGHPAEQLIQSADKEFGSLLKKQSKSLAEAVREYRRRNGIPPPPHFDKWYEFATRAGVELIDEFDTINHSLLPFWALKPATIRSRTKLALGQDNALLGLMIRDGNVVNVERGQEWQQKATIGMMKDFVQYLPDMDLAFNIHDEPRVVVPHDQLSALVAKAKDEGMPAAVKNEVPRNEFSSRPADMNDGKRFEEAKVTRFNRFAHQPVWTHSRLSCSPNSQARNYEEEPADNLTSYAAGTLSFVYNTTAFSDICNSPSLSYTFGFFDRPNAFNVIHELTAVFSQSKVSSYQDILYPSPWYWAEKVRYDEERDTPWENKTNSLYWRGSTTGGYSRDGGWRRQHRQHIVQVLNAPDQAKILVNKGDETTPEYQLASVPRSTFKEAMDVHFSHVGQCDDPDCEAQKQFFDIAEPRDGQDAWYYKHLLDMDGNAFSGRFYSFLKSKSLTYKMAVFREWHADWLKPWVHYIPLSLIGDEHLELVRWFGSVGVDGKAGDKGGNGDSLGEKRAKEIAERSKEWADKVLRNVDFEVWFFRLLLEYGRVIDDRRDEIGYPGP